MNRKILIYIFILLLSVLSVVRAEAQSLKAVYENHVLDAVQKYDSGNYDAAIGILNAVLEKDPDNDAACYYLALSYLFKKELDAAESFLKRAVTWISRISGTVSVWLHCTA